MKIDDIYKFESDALRKYGFYIHYVFDEIHTPTKFNIHTHGIAQSFNHLDLQIIIPIPQEVAAHILNDLGARIKDGMKYEAGKEYEGLLRGDMKVTFMQTNECRREVLRLIFPDKYGCLDKDKMDGGFGEQWVPSLPWGEK